MIKGLFSLLALMLCVLMAVSIENCLLSSKVKRTGGFAGTNHRAYASLSPLEESGTLERMNTGYGFGGKISIAVENGRYYEYSGVVHIHTIYSDGGGTYAEIAAAADSLGLDFIIPTDHNTLAPLSDGWARKYGGVLIIPAVENSTDRRVGHFLSIGDSLSLVRSSCVSSDSVYRDTLRRGNMIFLAHIFHPAYNAWRNGFIVPAKRQLEYK